MRITKDKKKCRFGLTRPSPRGGFSNRTTDAIPVVVLGFEETTQWIGITERVVPIINPRMYDAKRAKLK